MQKQNNFKITPDVRKQIAHLLEKLPDIPYYIKGNNGEIIVPKIAISKFIGTQDFLDSNGHRNKQYTVNSQKGQKLRLRNHKVELNEFYQKFGQPGIDQYVKYVFDVFERIPKPTTVDKIKNLVKK